jgi:hypothetical protein
MSGLKVTPKRLSQLYDKVYALLQEEVGGDDEGDPLVQFILTPRETCMPLHWFAIPYPWKAKTKAERLTNVKWACTNLKIAQDQVEKCITELELTENE